jgi:hypothetical protein
MNAKMGYGQIDEDPFEFYIIKKGAILIETIIEIDEYNRFPVVKFLFVYLNCIHDVV